MTEKTPFDLDAALAALERDERTSRPEVSENLQARVLGDAAVVAGGPATLRRPAARGRRPWLLGMFDAWSGAAAAAAVVCLLVGFGVGYEAGPEVIEQAGLDGIEFAVATDDGDGAFLWEDVL